jgi:hypothetical protein
MELLLRSNDENERLLQRNKDQVKQRVDVAKEKECYASLRKKDEYDVLFAKVQEIQNLNLRYDDKWNKTQLKVWLNGTKEMGLINCLTRNRIWLQDILPPSTAEICPPQCFLMALKLKLHPTL